MEKFSEINLFNDFPSINKSRWINQIKADLKTENIEKKIYWNNFNDIKVDSFFVNGEVEPFGRLLKTSNKKNHIINYRRFIVDKEDKIVNKEIHKAIEEGVNGIILDLKNLSSAYDLLEDVNLNEINIVFILRKKELEFAKNFYAFINEFEFDKNNICGYLDLDVIYNYLTTGVIDCSLFDKLKELTDLFKSYPNFKTISISGRLYQDSGASQVQEIAYTLSSFVMLLERMNQRNVDLKTIFNKLHFELAIGSEYFVEIAKFRVFRILFDKIAEVYKMEKNYSYCLSGKTSIWTKSVLDLDTNILRLTSESLSALLGGVDGLEIDPHDSQSVKSSEFSKRIASNILNILIEESFISKVKNPADGSFYIEKLSSQIAEKALELFQIIEEYGGFYETFEKERIQKQISEKKFERLNLISKRKTSLIGINKFPNFNEKVSKKVLSKEILDANQISKELRPRRSSLEFETLRRKSSKVEKEIESKLKVVLVEFGDKKQSSRRSEFAKDFIGVAGLNSNKFYLDLNNELKFEKKIKESKIVVLCSSDEEYEKHGRLIIDKLKKIDPDKVIVLAGNNSDLNIDLEKYGLDFSINSSSDIIQTLNYILNKLHNTLKPMEI